MPWTLYDTLIAGVPEDVLVRDCCLGLHWSYVDAECGMGVAHTVRGGATEAHGPRELVGMRLRDVAELSKSWHYEQATLGVAALNAWYCQPALLDALGARYDSPRDAAGDGARGRAKRDAFEVMLPRIQATEDAHVVVVGHFPHVERLQRYAHVTVLERACTHALDTPDPACEFVLPGADFAFITGITLTNKTAPRLLQLARGAVVSMVGPSVVMCQALLDAGVDMAAGRVVTDREAARACVKSGGVLSFAGSLQTVTIERMS